MENPNKKIIKKFNRNVIIKKIKSKFSNFEAFSRHSGISKSTIYNLNNDKNIMKKTLMEICSSLNIPYSALFHINVENKYDTGQIVGIKFPNTVNFRPKSYPISGRDDVTEKMPVMMIVCPIIFYHYGETGTTIRDVKAYLNVGEHNSWHEFQLRNWSDLVKAQPMLKEAEEIVETERPIPRGEKEMALSKLDAAWTASAPAPWNKTIHFNPFRVSPELPICGMEACFRATDQGLTWGDFLDYVDPDEDTDLPDRLRIVISTMFQPDDGVAEQNLLEISIERRCLRRVKHWIEKHNNGTRIPRFLQPRVIEGDERFCGSEGICCFTPGDECRPART